MKLRASSLLLASRMWMVSSASEIIFSLAFLALQHYHKNQFLTTNTILLVAWMTYSQHYHIDQFLTTMINTALLFTTITWINSSPPAQPCYSTIPHQHSLAIPTITWISSSPRT
ncbi:hypothetical protein O6H91_04G014500 [Diphasiastrum complanatum]|uniref:Uncharacterized protein n=1 Tax=Diphasiastrum complanatum TaxID=34168 RepID=A0ACC2DUH7_DIPCM|nr:hypothetical protein O6H91_04G014500 [Diphasiastrum complanatum]